MCGQTVVLCLWRSKGRVFTCCARVSQGAVLAQGSARVSHKPDTQAEDPSAPGVLPLPRFKNPQVRDV